MSTVDSYFVDFEKIIREMSDSVNRETLAILGGACAEADLRAFIQGWPLETMPYRVWEYVSSINFEKQTTKDSVPENMTFLEQARLFGGGGDLTLRRDDADFRWHFVGDANMKPPENFPANNFWEDARHKDMAFFRDEQFALLWGERQDGQPRWFDDRVGRAILDYPVDPSWRRVQLRYWTFSRAGQVEFVWLRGLEEWKEASNG